MYGHYKHVCRGFRVVSIVAEKLGCHMDIQYVILSLEVIQMSAKRKEKYREGWESFNLRLSIEDKAKLAEISTNTRVPASEIARTAIKKEIAEIQKTLKKADTASI